MSLLLETQISADADTRKKSEPGPIRPTEAAHIITSDAEAIEIAERLAEKFSTGASDRDHFRRWPAEELDLFSQSGLWSINVPKKFGGPELSYATVAKVTVIISGADPSLGQLPQNHLGVVAAINTTVRGGAETVALQRSVAWRTFRQCVFGIWLETRRGVRNKIHRRWGPCCRQRAEILFHRRCSRPSRSHCGAR